MFLLCAWLTPAWAQNDAQAPRPQWEGAVGIVGGWGPAFMGSDERRFSGAPAILLRHGRFSFSNNASSFAIRQDGDVIRGIGVDLTQREDLRVSLSLRMDGGRSESVSAQLRGMGDVRRTVRARLGTNWRFAPNWRVTAGWNVDILGRDGGQFGEVFLRREHDLSASTHVFAGAAVTVAGDRYMRSYFGVTPEQSARSGYPAYRPNAGIRDASLVAGIRHRLGPHWTALAGASATRLVGQAADSPLVRKAGSFGINAGLAWRF